MRICFYLFYLLVVFAGITGIAGAQVTPPLVCIATSQPLVVRAEGFSELTGDVVIVCSGGAVPTIGTILPQVNIAITLSTNITSRVLQDSLTEALLFVDDPQPGSQNPCTGSGGLCTPLTAGANGGALDNSGGRRNIFQGVRQSDNTVIFLGVPVNSPGINATRVFRVKNVRAAIAGSLAPGGQIFGYISIFNPLANMQLDNSTVSVAFIEQRVAAAVRTRTGGALGFNSSGGSALFQCQNWNSDLAGSDTARYSGANNSSGGRNLQIRYTEAYAGAFKVRDVNPAFFEPGIQQNIPQMNNGAFAGHEVESGFYNTAFPSANGLNRAGRADHGTRLRAAFNNVPPNVHVFVSTHALSNSALSVDGSNRQSGGGETTSYSAAYGVIALPFGQNQGPQTVLANPTSDTERVLGGNAAGYPAGAVAGMIEVPIIDGFGSYTWEVFATSPFQVDTLSFAVSFAYRTADNPGTGKVTMSGSFAPVGGGSTMSATATNPRFEDQSVSMDAAQISSCQSTCTFTLGTGNFNVGNNGGAGSVNIVASGPGCPWTATSSDAWVTISPPASGVGNGVVTFVVQSNPANSPRSTVVVISGQTLVVNQGCAFTLSATSFSMNAGGATASVDVVTQSVCVWSASSNSTWLSISSGSTGTGSGRVTFSATVNIGTARVGSLTVAGQNVTVTQDGTIPATPLRFVPLAPCRLMETRSEYNFQGRTGAFGPPYLARAETRVLEVPQSNVCQVPATAKAYVLNVTLVPRGTGVDFVTVWPAGELRPNFWTIRSPDRQTVANSAIVKAGPNGAIAVYASDDTDLLLDISGYYTDNPQQPGFTYYPLTPCRVVDTRTLYRSPAGPFGPPTMNAGERRTFAIPSATQYCQTPPGAKAYSVTITAAPPGPLQFLTAWPTGGSQPNVSNINSPSGRTLANSVIVPASANGSIDVFAFDRSDVLIDITGYFAEDNGQGLYYFPVTQCRVDDSQYNDEQGKTIGVPTAAGCTGIPATAKGYAASVTSISAGAPMPFLTLYPTGQPRPNASTLNAFEGQTITNSTIVPSGAGGSIDIFTYRRTRVVLEISGYFGR